LMLQQETPQDYVIATGEQHSVREFVDTAAKEVGISIEWRGEGEEEQGINIENGKCIVAVDPRYYRPTEVATLLGDPSKAKNELGWEPEVGFKELVSEMAREDLIEASREDLCLKHGFEVFQPQDNSQATASGWEKPDYVFLSAAKVGGIHANNTYPADFIRDNLQIQTNVIDAAYRHRVRKLLFLGSSCIYPKFAEQPIEESSLLSSALEPTNEFYAIAKIAGLKMCAAYRRQYGFDAISLMPTNLYGPGDNYDLENSHVIPALIRKFHEAKVS
ncbi:GDP-mannose 4,6-dehydratase, partial [Aduncisulcus paluster]